MQGKLRERIEGRWAPLPHQIAPAGDDWLWWLLLAGRGAGKTDAGANAVAKHVEGPACIDGPEPHRIGIVAPTLQDARETAVLGVSGLLRHAPHASFNRGNGTIAWPNGSKGRIFGAYTPEDVERLRGPQHCFVWYDELAAWRYLDDVWDMAEMGLRLGPNPRGVISTTPKPRKRVKALVVDADVAISKASTDDNPHLPEKRRRKLVEKYAGTRLGRQELSAELLEDVEGALWTRSEEHADEKGLIRWQQPPGRTERETVETVDEQGTVHRTIVETHVPDFVRVVVAVDPATTSGVNSDETGIVVAALASDRNVYVLDDRSVRLSPDRWGRRAIKAYHDFRADRVVAEGNNGGDVVKTLLRTIDGDVPVSMVYAKRGKYTRAEPVAGVYQQGRVLHAKSMPELEDQMCSWDPESDDSPDRVDALVWAITELLLLGHEGTVSEGPNIWDQE